MVINGVNHRMDVCPEIVHDRVVLPFRWVAQAFDTDVSWDNDKREVCFRNKNQQVQYHSPGVRPTEYDHNPSSYTNTLNTINNTLSGYFEDAGDDYFGDDGITTTISLSGSTSALAYTTRLDFSGADDYDDLTDVSASRIRTFLNAVRSRINAEIDGTDYDGADITGRLYDNDHSRYYVKYNGSTYTFSWNEDKYDTSVSEIRSRLDDYFEDAGDDYFGDDGITTTISLSGSTSALAYTIRLDFSGADDYDDLTDVSASRIRTFLNAVRLRINAEIDGTDYDGADITGRLYDNDHSSYYVRYNGSTYTFSW